MNLGIGRIGRIGLIAGLLAGPAAAAPDTRGNVKAFYETGDVPTEAQFITTWDSVGFVLEDETIAGGWTFTPLTTFTAGISIAGLHTIADSGGVLLLDSDADEVVVTGILQATGDLVAGGATGDGSVTIWDDDAGGDTAVAIEAADNGDSYTLTLPPDNGDAGEVMVTDGNGVTTWENARAQFSEIITGGAAPTLSISATTGEGFGSIHYVSAADTVTLPAVTSGASFTIVTIGAIAVTVDVQAGDGIMLDGSGTFDADGDSITNSSTAGDMVVFTYYSATGWLATSDGNWTAN